MGMHTSQCRVPQQYGHETVESGQEVFRARSEEQQRMRRHRRHPN
jgi:hypothetical protein